MADTKMVSEHRVLSPKQKGKELGVVDSEVKKEKNGKKRYGRWSKKRMIGTQYRKWKRVCP